MLGKAVWVLRQPRYVALAVFMVVVAALCVVAGTWQISRYEQTVRDNNALRDNYDAATVALTTALVPIVGQGAVPGRDAIRYRTVSLRGQFVPRTQQYLANQTQHGTDGFYVLDQFRSSAATLLVVRGFVAAKTDGRRPLVAPPPAGAVAISGRLHTAETGSDGAGHYADDTIASINPAEQMTRLGKPVYNAYLNLLAGQPGTAGVTVLAKPSLANPAGGAAEWQHMAYIVQWYLFALMALIAPFAMARHEVREARVLYLGYDPDDVEFGLERLAAADRPALTAGSAEGDDSAGGTVAVRADATVARFGEPSTQQWEQAARLADRYGRSIGTRPTTTSARSPILRRFRKPQLIGHDYVAPNSRLAPHRATDAYHAAYNDYLWELGLADGETPDVQLPGPAGDAGTHPAAPRREAPPDVPQPVVVEHDEPDQSG